MEIVDPRPLLALGISLACALLVFATGRHYGRRVLWSMGAALLKFGVVISLLPGAMAGEVYLFRLVEFPPGVGIGFRVDLMGLFFALVSSTLWIFTTIYAIGYMRGEADRAQVRFFGFFALCVAATVGIAFAENLLTLFIFYELLTVCTYPLVIHKETPAALKAGRKYLIYTLGGGGLVLLGLVLVQHAAGTLSFGQTGLLAAGAHDGPLGGGPLGGGQLGLIFAVLVLGFGVKAAVMPLHGWLPSAMVAPTPVSALLHAVAVVKAGAFGILRVIYDIFGLELLAQLNFTQALAWLAVVSIIGGSLLAWRQVNLKRRLAYSTVSQVSYILLAASLLNPTATVVAIMHLANQGFAKITMFFVAGAIEQGSGRTEINQLDGIGRQMPWSLAAFTVAALSFIGVPLLAGFLTKWLVILGALEGEAWWFAAVMVISGLLNAVYWLPVVYRAYFRPVTGVVADPGWLLRGPIIACAAFVVLLGTTAHFHLLPFSVASEAARVIWAEVAN
ncbi:proton-conducting transporter membrane subunit [Desulfurivibrio dismutans]|uniref:proton-conducting transporter transmembrane domain-containing protein n=1 Tax=Desulfurivibrio dismutans TaxID=1398908 RepID=UPI0023D9925A|nr:proton-conducting transporter membrane subunit [Desulfurivibrio alkaliphilus]MDF1614419.1 proton-conducting transporter membrane subunit [Desulfurivibrio alkaliphilus]